MNWENALTYLESVRSNYIKIGPGANWFVMNHVLPPIDNRLHAGERTQELYDEIMSLE